MTTIYFPQDPYESSRGACVALGNFDGVHIAHQDLIQRAIYLADNENLDAVVYTFDGHPRRFLNRQVELLTANQTKTRLIEALGADVLVYQQLTQAFLALAPEDFVKEYIAGTFHAKRVVVGKHFTFGKGGAGDAKMLKELGLHYGFQVEAMELITNEGIVISSTNIRALLKEGKLEEANDLLGRPFEVEGIVEKGNQIGNQMGFPTINLYPQAGLLLPKYGVYAAKALIDGTVYPGIANVGVKPTIDANQRPLVETHLFGVEQNFYGREARVSLLHFIRPEKKFDGLEQLKIQIAVDSLKAKKLLK